MGVDELDDAEFERLYGPWARHGPADVAALLDGYPGLWWVGGGWAIEAFTGVARPHHDVDPEVPREQLPMLRAHLAGRLDVWTASSGALCPLLPDDRPDASPDELLPTGCGQLWLRPGATEPWDFDLLLSASTATEWVCKRDERVRMPIDQALWTTGGVRYLRPELQLLLKARHVRPQDQADLEATLPLLDDERRTWLADALATVHPGHRWLDALR